MALLDDNDPLDAALDGVDGQTGPLSRQVYDVLRSAILEMRLPPGTLLRKQVICQRLGVSRSPVAEAVTRLATEGLVDIVPQSGSRVARFSMREIREGAFIREAIELAAVEKVALERTEDQLAELVRNYRLQGLCLQDGDETGFYREDEKMHGLIFSYTGYPRLDALAATGWIQVNRARLLILPLKDRAYAAFDEHKDILDAIRDRNPDGAREAMKKHLSELVTRLEPLARSRPDLFE